jgi:uncharacterized protein YybS (DUF2232 family)
MHKAHRLIYLTYILTYFTYLIASLTLRSFSRRTTIQTKILNLSRVAPRLTIAGYF